MALSDSDRKKLIDEAADIFVRLSENPQDMDAQALLDAFLARGKAEREVYAYVKKAWAGSGKKTRSKKLPVIVCLFGLAISWYLFAEPARNLMLADFSTRLETRKVELASGDVASLDADTAITDETDGKNRRVRILEGAVLFEVETDGREFAVDMDDVTIEVVGTTFEVSSLDNGVLVSVVEGAVQTKVGDRVWKLGEGDQFMWTTGKGGEVSQIDPSDIALWRQNRFAADGLTFSQVAAVIDRRLSGNIIIPNSALAQSRVSGTINLDDPQSALAALAAVRGARIVTVPLLGNIILASN
ncbi:MAG: FecR domain-containing protein [Pseudomonadota bacterium]